MAAVERCQVVIAGAGPVGTVLATLLAQAGVDVVVLEAGSECAQDLRASTFHPPSLEMLDQIGITQMLIDKGLKAPIYHWRDRQSGEVIDFDLAEISDVTKYPFRIQCEQYHLSQGLAEGLGKYSNAQVRFGSRIVSFNDDGTGVDVFVETMTGIDKLRCDFLIGADGANSIVRKWLGVEFDGFTYPERFLTLSTELELADHLPNLCYVNYVSDPQEWLVLLRVPSVWRVLVPTDPEADEDYLRSDEVKNGIFDRLIGEGAGKDVKTGHRTLYRVHQRVAKSFREGRVMLCGDASHLNNPLGGFGMNSGIHDAFNLFEKLMPVIEGKADMDANLSLYDRQRRTVTHSFTQTQTKANMAMIKGGQDDAHQQRRQAMLDIKADDDKRRAYMMRQAMYESLEQAKSIT
ncbi:NAD(P)/FAD-dependent oxidoreductase [Novosphingobium sp. BW1]|uniref:FAD-dependent oxidoreductase n=1 Tax=Novosphingobium sp. BW1 TaxID=2592621 RepID=UPI0011DE6B41|nr:FAD-dependent monooxygenase [Novosphingobium sp. BW1]TYC90879.1 FAD-dependent monooxygenase [Novosphingobium sp. BW1]